MIRKLKIEDIVKLLKRDEPGIEQSFFKDNGQWVQFLIQNVKNENLFSAGRFDAENNLIDYFVCIFKNKAAYLIYKSDGTESEEGFKKTALEGAGRFGIRRILFGGSTQKNFIWAGV